MCRTFAEVSINTGVVLLLLASIRRVLAKILSYKLTAAALCAAAVNERKGDEIIAGDDMCYDSSSGEKTIL